MLKYLSGWLSLLAYKRTLLHWSLAIVTPLMKIPKGKKTKGKKKGALFYFHKILLAKPTMIPTSYIPLPLFPWSCNITNRKPRTCLLKTHFSVMDFIFVHREAFYKHDPFWWLFKLLYNQPTNLAPLPISISTHRPLKQDNRQQKKSTSTSIQ